MPWPGRAAALSCCASPHRLQTRPTTTDGTLRHAAWRSAPRRRDHARAERRGRRGPGSHHPRRPGSSAATAKGRCVGGIRERECWGEPCVRRVRAHQHRRQPVTGGREALAARGSREQLIAPQGGSIVKALYHDIDVSRSLPWSRRPAASQLLEDAKSKSRPTGAASLSVSPSVHFRVRSSNSFCPSSHTSGSSFGFPNSVGPLIRTARLTIW